MTTVVKVNAKDRAKWAADPDFVYVGRAARGGWKNSIWSNPFKIAKGRLVIDRRCVVDWEFEEVPEIPSGMSPMTFALRCYAHWIKGQMSLGTKSFYLRELRNKRLGCWCGCWTPGEPEIHCHAVTLAKLANALAQEPTHAHA
jgi:hypothetical protein